MLHIIEHTLIDSFKLLPFLFITFLLMEYLEHKVSKKTEEKIESSGKYGPIIGSILGIVPQCGFSVAATNLYAARIITMGTLISIYLVTSDEMLPILLSHQVSISLIISIITIKIAIGILSGYIIDLLIRKQDKQEIKNICDEEHCDCEHGILKSSIKHTLHIFLFIVIVEFILNIGMNYLGTDVLEKIFMKNTVFGSFLMSIVGMIPNCASSVVITELYLNEAITFGSMMAGLLANSGVALIVLFRTNKDIKENIKILTIVYFIGAISGLIIDIIGLII